MSQAVDIPSAQPAQFRILKHTQTPVANPPTKHSANMKFLAYAALFFSLAMATTPQLHAEKLEIGEKADQLKGLIKKDCPGLPKYCSGGAEKLLKSIKDALSDGFSLGDVAKIRNAFKQETKDAKQCLQEIGACVKKVSAKSGGSLPAES
ncbi:hypothetical protein E4U41_002271 [Claviceps citrina]|nr:hypothetical protein E4U41_002271 [Claviceps citrina]